MAACVASPGLARIPRTALRVHVAGRNRGLGYGSMSVTETGILSRSQPCIGGVPNVSGCSLEPGRGVLVRGAC